MEKPRSVSNELLQRLEKLEKQNRKFKKLGILGTVIVVAALIMGQAASKTRIIEAERFVLRDKNGFTRAELATKTDGAAGLYLYNPQRFKALKETWKAAGGMEIKDPPDISLELSSDGSPKLRFGVIGEPNTELYVSSTGGAGLNIFSIGGYSGLRVDSDGSPVLSLRGSGTRGVRISYSPKGEPLLYITGVRDNIETPLAGLATSDDGTPFLFISDKEGHVRATLTTRGDGKPILYSYDEMGSVQTQEILGVTQKGPMWVLWEQGLTLGGIGQGATEVQFIASSVARGAWPSKQECETHRAQWEQANQGRKIPAVFTCLPDTVNLRGKS